MRDNFTVGLDNFRAGRMYANSLQIYVSTADFAHRWTLVTACFSHEMTGHLFMNAFTYYFMAPAVLGALGNFGFLGLYLGGAHPIPNCAYPSHD